jgi:hypothetical protein
MISGRQAFPRWLVHYTDEAGDQMAEAAAAAA